MRVDLVILAVFLLLEPVAGMLGQAPPPPAGLLAAVLAMPALLAADYLYKVLKHSASVRHG